LLSSKLRLHGEQDALAASRRIRRQGINRAVHSARDWVAPYVKAVEGDHEVYRLIEPVRDTHIIESNADLEPYYELAASDEYFDKNIYFFFPGFIEMDSGKVIAEVFDTVSVSEKPAAIVRAFGAKPSKIAKDFSEFLADRL